MLSYYRNENIFLNKRFESYNSNMRRCCGEYALFLFRCNMRKGTEKSHLALLSCFLLFGHFRKSFANCQSGNHSVCVFLCVSSAKTTAFQLWLQLKLKSFSYYKYFFLVLFLNGSASTHFININIWFFIC